MMSEQIVASVIDVVQISTPPPTYAGPGKSWRARYGIAIVAAVIGRIVKTPMIAVRRPVLGTIVARKSTCKHAYTRQMYADERRSNASAPAAPKIEPGPT